MPFYILLFITFLLAFTSIYSVVTARSALSLLKALMLGWLVYSYGTWVFLSIYFKYFFLLGTFLSLIVFLHKNKGFKRPTLNSKISNIVGITIFTTVSILRYTGIVSAKNRQVNITFPFRQGTYFIYQGGRGIPGNTFHTFWHAAVFALDITKLNNMGSRASKPFSQNVNDYFIYGDTITSPCNGIVKFTINNKPDNIPPNLSKGRLSLNCLLIENKNFYVFLGHFKKGTLRVNVGDTVHTGQPLACVGNSGFSIEPHLHLQIQENTHTGLTWYLERPMQPQFNGKTYNLFDVIKN